MKRGRNHQRRRQGVNINRAYDSNGPEVRIRGTANQIYDKYLALARDAHSSGDRIKAENYHQHAEHYFRVIRSMAGAPTPQAEVNDGDNDQPSLGGGQDRERPRETASADAPEAHPPVTGESGTPAGRPANGPSGAPDQANADGPRRSRRRRPRHGARPEGDETSEEESEPAEAAAS